jgi:flagellar biosynthesis protein FlhB
LSPGGQGEGYGIESRDGVVLSELEQAASTTATATTSETAATAITAAAAAATTAAPISAQQPICAAAAATGCDSSWSFTTEHIFPAFNHLSPAIAYDPDGDGISVI